MLASTQPETRYAYSRTRTDAYVGPSKVEPGRVRTRCSSLTYNNEERVKWQAQRVMPYMPTAQKNVDNLKKLLNNLKMV